MVHKPQSLNLSHCSRVTAVGMSTTGEGLSITQSLFKVFICEKGTDDNSNFDSSNDQYHITPNGLKGIDLANLPDLLKIDFPWESIDFGGAHQLDALF